MTPNSGENMKKTWTFETQSCHYDDVMLGAIASQITSLTIIYSIFYSDADQRKPQSSASLAFVREIHRGPVNSPHKWPVTRKMFPFDDIMVSPYGTKRPQWVKQYLHIDQMGLVSWLVDFFCVVGWSLWRDGHINAKSFIF